MPLSILQKNSESVLWTSWHPGYGENIYVCVPLLPGPLRYLIHSVLEGECKSTKIGLAMGVTFGGDAAKSGKNTHLLVLMRVRLPQKIGLLDSIQKRKRL